jgi:Helix-turn-helix
MRGQTGDTPVGVLRAIDDDLTRRNQAKKDLTSTLTSYLEELPRDPAALPTSIVRLAEIWGAYAVTLYDSLALRHFCGSPNDIGTLFGESGELYGGATIVDVKRALANLKVRPGRGWLEPNFSRDGDSLEMVNTMSALAHTLTATPYSFSWLLNEAWFNTEIWNRVRGRSNHWRQKFEQQFAVNRDSIQALPQTSGKPQTAVSKVTRLRRREILKCYRDANEISTQEALARHLGVSPTALQGMVRGDRTRYSDEKLKEVLKKMNTPFDEWRQQEPLLR